MILRILKFLIPHFTTEWTSILEPDDGEYEINTPLSQLTEDDDLPTIISPVKIFKWFGVRVYLPQNITVYYVEAFEDLGESEDD